MNGQIVREIQSPIRQLKTSWLEAGERGKPILFLCHGFPDSPQIWSHQIEALAMNYHVVAPYVRGCESSEPADDIRRYSRESILLDHLEILKLTSNGHEPVICVGHDLGAVHAMAMSRRLGDRLAGLVVINGLDVDMFTKRLREPSQVLKSWYMGLMQVPMLPEALATWAPNSSHWLSQTLGGTSGDREHQSTKEFTSEEVKRFERRTVAPLNQYRAFARESADLVSKSEPRIKSPVLVLWGRDDGVLLAPTQKEWDLVAHDVVIRIIPGGHWLQRDEADVVTKLISDFADKNLSSAH